METTKCVTIPSNKESQLELQLPKKHTRDVHILSLAFLLIFLAYGAAQNLQSTLNTVSFFFFFCIWFMRNI